MKIFTYLYDKTLNWSAHNHAPYYLAGVSFAESSFFPIPPDVMLISMGLSAPRLSWRYAVIATLFSVLGGIFGYCIGYYFMELMGPYLMSSSYGSTIKQVMNWFEHRGVLVVIVAGFSPFPYKIFTITAGAMNLAFFPFLIGSIVGRGLRFFLVSAILFFAGHRIEKHLRQYVDIIGWSMLVIFVIVYLLTKLVD